MEGETATRSGTSTGFAARGFEALNSSEVFAQRRLSTSSYAAARGAADSFEQPLVAGAPLHHDFGMRYVGETRDSLGGVSLSRMGDIRLQGGPNAAGAIGKERGERQYRRGGERWMGRDLDGGTDTVGLQLEGALADRGRHGRLGLGATLEQLVRVDGLEAGASSHWGGRTPRGASGLARVAGDLSVWTTQGASPGWAQRAVHGTSVGVGENSTQTGFQVNRTEVAFERAVARAATPVELLEFAQEHRSELSRSARLSKGLAHAVERLVVLGGDTEEVSHDEKVLNHFVPMRSWRGESRSVEGVPTMESLARSAARPKDKEVSPGADQTMKLAKKLMSLVHLSEAERKVQAARGAVRMAEDSAAAKAEASAGPTGGEKKVDGGAVKALERQVLEAVLRELELTQQRRLEDPDGRNIWW